MFPIHEVTDVEMAFPASVIQYMPKWEDIPKEFKDGDTRENELITQLFFKGLKSFSASPREGVNGDKAFRHLRMVLGSFEPKHEHKEAACSFLMREWFLDFEYEKNDT